MKNEVFNASRFRAYFKYDFTQMWRNHVKASIGIGLSGLILYVASVGLSLIFSGQWSGPSLGARMAAFIMAGTAMELYQTRTYGYLTDKRKGSAWLMLPASTMEKWLSMILMTIFVIPIVFLTVFLLSDLVLASFDPTVGASIVHSVGNGFRELSKGILEINGNYETSWDIWAFAPAAFVSLCFNFLFFLFCGIFFKKNKILSAFVIIFIFSALLSIGMSLFGLANNTGVVVKDFAEAEIYIRQILNKTTCFVAVATCALAGGIYWRLKTLKH